MKAQLISSKAINSAERNAFYTRVGCTPQKEWWTPAWEAAQAAAIAAGYTAPEQVVGLLYRKTDNSCAIFQIQGVGSVQIRVAL